MPKENLGLLARPDPGVRKEKTDLQVLWDSPGLQVFKVSRVLVARKATRETWERKVLPDLLVSQEKPVLRVPKAAKVFRDLRVPKVLKVRKETTVPLVPLVRRAVTETTVPEVLPVPKGKRESRVSREFQGSRGLLDWMALRGCLDLLDFRDHRERLDYLASRAKEALTVLTVNKGNPA